MLQSSIIIGFSIKSIIFQLDLHKLGLIILINILLTIIISSLSLSLAFILPGHIEFLACTLLLNLPTLFTSTALAPLYLMPYWLQVISKFNILTYAIESFRFITINQTFNETVFEIFGINFNLDNIFLLLIILSLISIALVTSIINNKLE